MSFLDDMLGGKINKEAMDAQGKNAQDHFEKKVEAYPWVESILELDPVQVEAEYQAKLAQEAMTLGKTAAHSDAFAQFTAIVAKRYGITPADMGIDSEQDMPMDETPEELATRLANDYDLDRIDVNPFTGLAFSKKAAYEKGDSTEETLKKDYERDVKILSDYALAEMLAEYRGQAENNLLEKFSELKEEAKKNVASGRDKCETELLKLIGTHTALDWQKKFAEFTKDAKVEQPKEKDLYEPKLEEKKQNWEGKEAKDKDFIISDKEKSDVGAGNGREVDQRTEAIKEAGEPQEKKASLEKKAQDWKVRYYDKDDKVISSHVIKDRTEHEAEKEATGDMPSGCDDWSMMPVKEKKAEKVKDSPANDKGNIAMPEGKKSAGDKPEESVEEPTAGMGKKEVGDKSDQSAEANSPEKGDKAKDIESVNKEAHCGSCPGDPGVKTTAELCPVCGSEGKDLANNQKDHYACMGCGISYGHKEGSCGSCESQEIQSHASKSDVIKKVAEIESPWIVAKDAEGNEVIARRDVSELSKVSEEEKTEELKK